MQTFVNEGYCNFTTGECTCIHGFVHLLTIAVDDGFSSATFTTGSFPSPSIHGNEQPALPVLLIFILLAVVSFIIVGSVYFCRKHWKNSTKIIVLLILCNILFISFKKRHQSFLKGNEQDVTQNQMFIPLR